MCYPMNIVCPAYQLDGQKFGVLVHNYMFSKLNTCSPCLGEAT